MMRARVAAAAAAADPAAEVGGKKKGGVPVTVLSANISPKDYINEVVTKPLDKHTLNVSSAKRLVNKMLHTLQD